MESEVDHSVDVSGDFPVPLAQCPVKLSEITLESKLDGTGGRIRTLAWLDSKSSLPPWAPVFRGTSENRTRPRRLKASCSTLELTSLLSFWALCGRAFEFHFFFSFFLGWGVVESNHLALPVVLQTTCVTGHCSHPGMECARARRYRVG